MDTSEDLYLKELLQLRELLPNGAFGNVFSENGKNNWFCALCRRSIASGASIRNKVVKHMNGKKHMARLKLSRRQRSTIKPTSSLQKSFVQLTVDNFKDGPVVGLEYLLEVLNMESRKWGKQAFYMCVLCWKRGSLIDILKHMASYQHKLKYLIMHFPKTYKLLHPYYSGINADPKKKEKWHEYLDDITWAIEGTFGRLKPVSMEFSLFNQDRKKYYAEIREGKHFTDSAEFENFVREAYLTEDQEEMEMDLSKKEELHRENLFRTSPSRESAVSNEVKKNKTKNREEFFRLSKAIDDEMEQEMMKYKETPEAHPHYNDEWIKFWKEKYATLKNKGKDPSSYDFTPEWKQFWNKKMMKIHAESKENRKMALRIKLGLDNNQSVSEPTQLPEVILVGDDDSPKRSRKRPRPTSSSVSSSGGSSQHEESSPDHSEPVKNYGLRVRDSSPEQKAPRKFRGISSFQHKESSPGQKESFSCKPVQNSGPGGRDRSPEQKAPKTFRVSSTQQKDSSPDRKESFYSKPVNHPGSRGRDLSPDENSSKRFREMTSSYHREEKANNAGTRWGDRPLEQNSSKRFREMPSSQHREEKAKNSGTRLRDSSPEQNAFSVMSFSQYKESFSSKAVKNSGPPGKDRSPEPNADFSVLPSSRHAESSSGHREPFSFKLGRDSGPLGKDFSSGQNTSRTFSVLPSRHEESFSGHREPFSFKPGRDSGPLERNSSEQNASKTFSVLPSSQHAESFSGHREPFSFKPGRDSGPLERNSSEQNASKTFSVLPSSQHAESFSGHREPFSFKSGRDSGPLGRDFSSEQNTLKKFSVLPSSQHESFSGHREPFSFKPDRDFGPLRRDCSSEQNASKRPREMPYESHGSREESWNSTANINRGRYEDSSCKNIGESNSRGTTNKQDTDENVIAVLRLLIAVEERLGSLGPRIIDLMSEALAMENEKPNSSSLLLGDKKINVLLETTMEKLKGQLQAGLVTPAQEKIISNIIQKVQNLLIAGRNNRPKENESFDNLMIVPGVGLVDRDKMSKDIVDILMRQGKKEITEDELKRLMKQMVERSTSKPTSSNYEDKKTNSQFSSYVSKQIQPVPAPTMKDREMVPLEPEWSSCRDAGERYSPSFSSRMDMKSESEHSVMEDREQKIENISLVTSIMSSLRQKIKSTGGPPLLSNACSGTNTDMSASGKVNIITDSHVSSVTINEFNLGNKTDKFKPMASQNLAPKRDYSAITSPPNIKNTYRHNSFENYNDRNMTPNYITSDDQSYRNYDNSVFGSTHGFSSRSGILDQPSGFSYRNNALSNFRQREKLELSNVGTPYFGRTAFPTPSLLFSNKDPSRSGYFPNRTLLVGENLERRGALRNMGSQMIGDKGKGLANPSTELNIYTPGHENRRGGLLNFGLDDRKGSSARFWRGNSNTAEPKVDSRGNSSNNNRHS